MPTHSNKLEAGYKYSSFHKNSTPILQNIISEMQTMQLEKKKKKTEQTGIKAVKKEHTKVGDTKEARGIQEKSKDIKKEKKTKPVVKKEKVSIIRFMKDLNNSGRRKGMLIYIDEALKYRETKIMKKWTQVEVMANMIAYNVIPLPSNASIEQIYSAKGKTKQKIKILLHEETIKELKKVAKTNKTTIRPLLYYIAHSCC